MRRPGQMSLFGTDPSAVGLATIDESTKSIAEALPRTIRLGTSSWSFPGWRGIVWDREATESELAATGLRAYARHPLLRAVGIDRTYYAPLPATALAEYALQVPDDFRFVVKASSECTSPEATDGGLKQPNLRFLDARWARENVVSPFVEGLRDKGGVLVFQFPPLGRQFSKDPARFAARLHDFLDALPEGPRYAVELRDVKLFSVEYLQALRSAGAVHCFNVHPRMTAIGEQFDRAGLSTPLLVCRWMLHSGLRYESAREKYAPFSRLVDEDAKSRIAIAAAALTVVRRGGEVLITANNKAEGCAPLSISALAGEIVQVSRA